MNLKWNPFMNAIGAVAYIGLVVLFMHFIETLRHDTPDTLVDGMGVLSLFVFSAAIMAFLFFYQPVLILLEHKKSEALSYFLKTLGIFGGAMVIILIISSLQ